MPHIHATLLNDPAVCAALRADKTLVRYIVSSELGYPLKNVVLKSEILRPENVALSDNLPALLFTIYCGSRVIEHASEHTEKISELISTLPNLGSVPCNIWLRPAHGSVFIEKTPHN